MKGKGTKKKGSQKGMSLVELMAATSIGILIVMGLYGLYDVSHITFRQGGEFFKVHSDVRMALDWMTRDIKWATRLMNSKSGYNTGTEILVLEVPAIDASGDVIDADSTYDYIIYHLDAADSTKLLRTVDAAGASSRSDETRVVANNVDLLRFGSNGILLGGIGDVTDLTEVVVEITTKGAVAGEWVHEENRSTVIELRNQY
jgi:hypothetical protein